jgi:pimeloyl-ACP methyl ester carboxylesterase
MFRLAIPAVLSAAAVTSALPSAIKRQDSEGSSSVEWTECEYPFQNDYDLPIECGTLDVPLDYTDEDNEYALSLNLIKIPASRDDKLGHMLFNPGGPGESGILATLGLAQELQIVSGGRYDIIGFDPRGTGRTIPVSCSAAAGATPVDKRDTTIISEDLMELAERKWPWYAEFAQNCSVGLAETGHLVGTAFVARDMLQIVEALEEDGMLRYYGTIIPLEIDS